MHIPDDIHFYRNNDPLWSYLAEISLGELMLGMEVQDELTNLLLHQITRNLGIPQEKLEISKQTLQGFIRQALGYITQGKFESPVYLRLFCQRKTLASVSSMDCESQFDSQEAIESAPLLRHVGADMTGAWGYFLVERSAGSFPGSSGEANKIVDLYLYREGE